MSKATVAFLHYTVQPVIGGVENVISEHVRVFEESGYTVRVIAGRGGEAEVDRAQTRIIPRLDSKGEQNREIADSLDKNRVPAFFSDLQAAIQDALAAVLRDIDVLIVHNVLNFHFNLPLTAALYSLVEAGQAPPTVAWCHDISRYVNPRSGADQRSGFPWDMLRTYNPAIRYVAVSAPRQKALAKILGISPDRIRVIPNGVSPEMLLGLSRVGRHLLREHGIMEADVILLMPIRITTAKNIEFALKVTAALKKEGLIPRLIVTGPPDPHASTSQVYFHELLSMRSELGLEREALFIYEGAAGASPMTVDLAGIAEFYRIADIVFMPSHREGFGMPILEGGLLGKPIFASRIPAVEVLGSGAVHLIRADETPQHVAARMRQWANTDVEHRLRRRVRREYTWQGIFKREIEPVILDCLRHTERS